ncbi:hypothetical protein A3H80_03790 [Candidatus Roizmanbacteria bacterium RIFCSPLOWO2_02_FULL_37_19]|uniref:Uncharacterized protein n=1 Tax=Candidatus Roizmanbacteria bacterium RIFCSPHIGHO2_02_FULL_37_24 TaxID=1802037 RepID=A0A1F7GV42_9BACT|nr:MAG: hypothetical protein A2862_01880 [Candidatus Roizmanbacteria bacterium RIFCSPHIGHO2_01_FULL_38_41]OGK22909.1 MAG: hypothetical protein A3C24_03550 [Candidatus Roizmanbacteria bacterium RIFCSPHIGHO2_02_FULL_37_24]OGK33637.1 MAG: hypothetical protein A3E10_05235 [Candidatus Roizmanbacteria bacterium RIFCSPHIGHO2_12_FULL_37_23]OGK44985.1 MAG: hypothetical protein A2956_00385 [Candidatus Roizmanbacteria bacterium RIFCSPLOWO2_01_FULL_37_57]OGK55289.1 MAG: hypothetical protein A3H80_03790 [Ca
MQNPSRRLRRMKSGLFKEKVVSYALKSALIGVVAFFLLGMAAFAYFSRDLPEPGKIQRREGFSTVFYDRNDKVLFEMFEDKNRIPVDIEDVPEDLKNATVAVEDKTFFKHKGFSTPGIARAMLTIVLRGRLAGGSTLTQQLVKNVLLTQERTVTRKIKELVLAVAIERKFSKDEILEMYLNESPYGGTFWGVQSASKGYFDKDVKDLKLVESAIIAGLPQRPSVYNPVTGQPDAYKTRAKDVLRRMREDEYITQAQEQQALKDLQKVTFEKAHLAIEAPHFVFYVRELVVKQFGEKILDQGIEIKTTLDSDVQKEAQKIVAAEIKKTKALHATNGSMVVLDSQTGEILAMVGSYDYNDEEFGRYNTAVAHRQPGSAVKPITYAVAFEQGYTPSSVVMDIPTEFPDQGGKTYNPINYDGKFRGPLQYRFALANSINVAAVKVLANVGIKNFLQKAYDMGMNDFEPTDENLKRFGLSITLGGGETTLLDLTSAYSSFARGGTYIEPSSILEIKNHKNKTIFKAKKPSSKNVLSQEVSFLISHILSDNNARADAFGTNSYLNIPGKTVAVKTGTTNDKRDNWTVGYTNDVTTGVWVGNNDNSPMNPEIASGLTGASSIWHKAMREFLKKYKDGIIEKPSNVEALQIDAFLGGLPREGQPIRSEYFIKGSEPTDISPFYKKLKISKNTGKLANEIEIKAGEFEEKDFIVIAESDPISTDGRNRWQEAIIAWTTQQASDIFRPPTELSDTKSDEIIISFKEPEDSKRINSNSIQVKAKITSLHSIKKVEILVNDNLVQQYDGDKREIDEPLNLPDGIYEIKIRAENVKGTVKDNRVRIGINKEWNELGSEPTPTPE